MKHFLLFFFYCLAFFANGQEAIGISGSDLMSQEHSFVLKHESLQSPVLDEIFERYEIFELPLEEIENFTSRQKDKFTISLHFGELPAIDLHLSPSYLWDGRTRLRISTERGIVEQEMPPSSTYRGYASNDERSQVACFFSERFCSGIIESHQSTIYWEPLFRFVPDAPRNLIVKYVSTDVKITHSLNCSVTDGMAIHEQITAQQAEAQENLAGCYEMDIAQAADWSMWQKYGGATGVIDYMASVINQCVLNFDNEFTNQLGFRIAGVWLSSCSTCEPWSNTTQADPLLVSFRDWGNGSNNWNLPFDIGQLWTNRDMDGSTVGFAYIGVSCTNSFRYQWIQDWTTGSFLRTTVSHELGHNLGASHDPDGSGHIMNPSSNGSNTWSTASQNIINPFIQNRVDDGCFFPCTPFHFEFAKIGEEGFRTRDAVEIVEKNTFLTCEPVWRYLSFNQVAPGVFIEGRTEWIYPNGTSDIETFSEGPAPAFGWNWLRWSRHNNNLEVGTHTWKVYQRAPSGDYILISSKTINVINSPASLACSEKLRLPLNGNTNDASSSAASVTVQGGSISYGTDHYNNCNAAARLSGGKYLEAPVINERAVSFWFKLNQQEQMVIYDSGPGGFESKDWEIGVYKPNGLGPASGFDNTFGLFFATWDRDIAIPFDALKTGWHHIAISRDASSFNRFRIMIDGQFPTGYMYDGFPTVQTWFPQTQPFDLPSGGYGVPNLHTPTYKTYIGKDFENRKIWETGLSYFDGWIDDIRVYGQLLSQEEMSSIYAAPDDNPNSVTATANQATYCEGMTMQLTASASNATAYSWSGPAGFSSTSQNPSRSNLTLAMAGNYTVTITISGGCTVTRVLNVVVTSKPTIATVSVPACSGQSNGSATVNVTTGTSPFIYAWSNGQNTQSVAGLPTGTYTVTVTGGGCSTTTTASIGSVAAGLDCGLVLRYKFNNNLTDASSNNNNGTAPNGIGYTNDRLGNCNQAGAFNGTNTYVSIPSSTSLNSPAASITLMGWAKAQSANTGLHSILCKGILGSNTIQYRLGVTSDNKMYFSYPTNSGLNFSDILQPISTFTIQNWNHYAVTFDGSKVRFYLNGVQVGTDHLLSTTIQSISTAPLEIGRDAPGLGNEYLTGALDELRIYSRALTLIEIQQIFNLAGDIPVSAAISATTSVCTGLTNGMATVTASGGITPYTFKWSNNQTNATAANLAAGTYTVTVTDNNGCTVTATATISTASLPTANISATTSACPGQANGSATVTASGGAVPYTYKWSDNQITATATNLTAGIYTVTVTGNNGCAAIAAATVAVTPGTNADFTASVSGQMASFTNLSVNALSYLWVFGNGETSTEIHPVSHLEPGLHQICLVATGICGADTMCQTVTVTPPDWETSPCNTGIVHTIAVWDSVIADINGQALEAGDLIGFFYTGTSGVPTCSNFGVWQNATLTLEVCGDNPATANVKEGYSTGENFLVRVWKDTAQYNTIPCYVPEDTYGANNPNATGSFTSFGLSYIDCLKTAPRPGISLGCDGPIPIACGETHSGNTADGVSAAIAYNCFYNLVDGPEVVYEFVNPVAQNVLITLTGMNEDLEILLLDACDRNSCVLYSDRTGSIPEALVANNLPAGTYFIIVEGYLGSDSPYTLHVTCGSNSTNNGTLDCTAATVAQCGQTVSGNTSTGSDQIVQYGCTTTYNSGKERIYTLTLPENKAVSATLFDLSSDLNLIVLGSCDPDDCITFSSRSGTENDAVLFHATAGKTYYFVVDGYFDAEGQYSLSFYCFDPCTDCPNEYDLNGPDGDNEVCSAAQILQCGVPVTGNNNNGNAFARNYSCPDSYTTGKEVVYKFSMAQTQDVTVILSGLSANLDLYLLNECTVFSCLASSHKIGNSNEGIVLQALPAGTYYVVVDGYNNALSSYSLVVNCSETALLCQQINLVAGVNFVSSNIEPTQAAINEILLPSTSSKIISIESQGNLSYSPIAQTDPEVFGDWDFRKAYRIKALAADSFNICGIKADPDTPIPFKALTPQGQTVNNWSAYLKDEPAQVSDKFTPTLTPTIFRVWNMPTGSAGTLTPQAWLVTAQSGIDFQMKPGRGYILNASMDGAYTFGLLSNDLIERSEEFAQPMIVKNGCKYFQTPLYNTLQSATIILPKMVLEQKCSLGDEIGLFGKDGLLFGSGLYQGFGLSIVISGDDVATADFLEGFSEGENMTLRLWKSKDQVIFDLNPTFLSDDSRFENEAVYMVNDLEVLHPSEVETPENMLQWNVSPNPATDLVQFDLLMPQAFNVRLEIFSSEGRLVQEIIDKEMPIGHSTFYALTSHLSPGYYLIKMTTGQNVSFKKVILSKR